MKTTQIEVKTFYTIRFDFHDFAKIYTDAKKDPCRLHAFENFDLDDTTLGNIKKCFKSLERKTLFPPAEEEHHRTENIKYIAHMLGFADVQWYGGFYRNSEEYQMIVYNYGADI